MAQQDFISRLNENLQSPPIDILAHDVLFVTPYLTTVVQMCQLVFTNQILGNAANIYLYGNANTGKTTICEIFE